MQLALQKSAVADGCARKAMMVGGCVGSPCRLKKRMKDERKGALLFLFNFLTNFSLL
jgi:hypothetical protein